MNLKYLENFDEVKIKWNAFWAGEMLKRPLVVAHVPKSGVYENFTADKYYNLINNDVDSFLSSVDKMLDATWYMAESVPFFSPDLGPDQIAAFLGSEIYSSEDSKNTSWVKHIVENKDDWSGFLPLKFDPDNKWLKQHSEICAKTAKHAKGKYVVGVADFHTNADALSALRSPGGLCMDLFDCPDKISNAMHDIRKLYSRYFESINTASEIDGKNGYISWIPFWSEKPYAVIQCDFLAMVGPDMAKDFFLPAIEEEASYLDNNIFHLDGVDALRHLENILGIDAIDAVQWVPGAGQKPMWQWTEILQKIQKAGKKVQVWDITCEQVKSVHKKLKPEGVVYCVQGMKYREEVDDLCCWLERNNS